MISTRIIEKKRLVSLDVFRGITIAGMIIVNTPGSWEYVFPPLLHSKWNGLTMADLVFPFFLFIVGVSIVLAYTPKIKKYAASSLLKDLFKRVIILFILGIILNLISYKFKELRLPGILQRISIVFLICSLLFLYTRKKIQIYISIAILSIYWLAMKIIPVPEFGAGVLYPAENLANYIDSIIIPFKMYADTWDPEGVLSTIPAIASSLFGMFTGYILLSNKNESTKVINIFVLGVFLCMLGAVVAWFFPINKNLWSSSYVLYTSGLANLFLASIYYIIDMKGKLKCVLIWRMFGTNAITAYVIHYVLSIPLTLIPIGNSNIQSLFMKMLIDVCVMPQLASLLWALIYTGICFVPIWILYRKKIFIKI